MIATDKLSLPPCIIPDVRQAIFVLSIEFDLHDRFTGRFLREYPTGGCWNKARFSVFYVTTDSGQLLVWDILQTLRAPVFTLKLCDEKLTALAPCEEGAFLTIGNYVGNVFLVEPNEFFQTFDRKDRTALSEVSERRGSLKSYRLRVRSILLSIRERCLINALRVD